MFCKNCGSKIEDGGKFCPKCGIPVETATVRPAREKSGKRNMKKAAETVSKAAETVAKKAQEIGEMGKDAWKKANGEEGVLKKILNRKNLKWEIPCVVILVVVISCIANASRLNNFFHKTFSSPEKYFQFVGKKSLKETSDLVGGYYSDILSWLEFYDTSYSGEFTLESGEEIQRLIKLEDALMDLDEAGIDLSALKSLKVGADVSIKDSVIGRGVTIAINEVDILSTNMIMDMNQGDMYLQIPELTKTYMGIEDYMGVDADKLLAAQQESYKELIQSLPKRANVEKLFSRYLMIALENIDDVSIGEKKELKVGEITQKCAELKAVIDGNTVRQVIEAILEEAMDDKNLEKIIVDMAEARGEDGDEVYDEFIEELEDMLDDVEYLADDDMEMKVTLYVDGKAGIIGMVMEQEDDGKFSVLTAKKGSNIAYEISSAEYGRDILEISGQGKKSGDLLTGDFEMKVYGQSALKLKVMDLDMEQLKRGYVNGKAEIKLSSELSRELSNEIDVSAASSIIKKSSLVINCKSSVKSIDCKADINYDGEKFLSATLTLKSGDGSKASIPKGNSVIMIEDGDDFMAYYDGIDWNKFLDGLEKTGVLSKMAEKLDDIIDDLDDLDDLDDVLRMFTGSYGGGYNYYY